MPAMAGETLNSHVTLINDEPKNGTAHTTIYAVFGLRNIKFVYLSSPVFVISSFNDFRFFLRRTDVRYLTRRT